MKFKYGQSDPTFFATVIVNKQPTFSSTPYKSTFRLVGVLRLPETTIFRTTVHKESLTKPIYKIFTTSSRSTLKSTLSSLTSALSTSKQHPDMSAA